jgi:formylglycine-generating enzyme
MIGKIASIVAIFASASLGGPIAPLSADPGKLAAFLDACALLVPAGYFLMGSETGAEDEKPMREVWVDAFRIGRFEVTNCQYARFARERGVAPPPHWLADSSYAEGMDDLPVVGVSWEEAAAYCAWAGGRLPTEAEWEKAARGSDGRRFPWGEVWEPEKAAVDTGADLGPPGTPGYEAKNEAYAWRLLEGAGERGSPRLMPVGSRHGGASPYGLDDMAGNASEWVADWYNWAGYDGLPDRNPLVTGPPWNHCFRGSSWFEPYLICRLAETRSRCSARNSSHATRDPRIGFRCAYDAAP